MADDLLKRLDDVVKSTEPMVDERKLPTRPWLRWFSDFRRAVEANFEAVIGGDSESSVNGQIATLENAVADLAPVGPLVQAVIGRLTEIEDALASAQAENSALRSRIAAAEQEIAVQAARFDAVIPTIRDDIAGLSVAPASISAAPTE